MGTTGCVLHFKYVKFSVPEIENSNPKIIGIIEKGEISMKVPTVKTAKESEESTVIDALKLAFVTDPATRWVQHHIHPTTDSKFCDAPTNRFRKVNKIKRVAM